MRLLRPSDETREIPKKLEKIRESIDAVTDAIAGMGNDA